MGAVAGLHPLQVFSVYFVNTFCAFIHRLTVSERPAFWPPGRLAQQNGIAPNALLQPAAKLVLYLWPAAYFVFDNLKLFSTSQVCAEPSHFRNVFYFVVLLLCLPIFLPPSSFLVSSPFLRRP